MAQSLKEVGLAKAITKASKSIRKKNRAIKFSRAVEDNLFAERLKPIVDPLNAIVENTQRVDTLEDLNNKTPEERRGYKRWRDELSATPITSTPFKQRLSKKQRIPLNPSILYEENDEPLEEGEIHDVEEIQDEPMPEQEEEEEEEEEEAYVDAQQQRQRNQSFDLLDNLSPLSTPYIRGFIGHDKDVDIVFAPRYDEHSELRMGSKLFKIDINDNIYLDNAIVAQATKGLLELIFKKYPDKEFYNDQDLQIYKEILTITNAHKRKYSANLPVKSSRGYKYNNVIAPLFREFGAGMQLTTNPVDYVHWDNPNELIDRLRLLIASRQAGNTGHINEINAIIEELEEANLIKKLYPSYRF